MNKFHAQADEESDEDYYKKFAHSKKTIYDTSSGKTVRQEISHELFDYYSFIYVAAILIRNGIKFPDSITSGSTPPEHP